MQRYDRLGGLIWIVIGMAIFVESIRLGTGSISTPGPGLIPLGCGLLLAALGLALFFFHAGTEPLSKEVQRRGGISWHKMVLALGYLVVYALLLEVLGFLLVTVLWLGANCRLGGMGWKKTALLSVTAALASFILFDYLLKVRMPRGIWGF